MKTIYSLTTIHNFIIYIILYHGYFHYGQKRCKINVIFKSFAIVIILHLFTFQMPNKKEVSLIFIFLYKVFII